jgi:hypothetical protein
MGLRFRTSFKIAPGLRLNIGKRGVTSLRIGPRGFGMTVGKRGLRASADLPGPFSISQKIELPTQDPAARPSARDAVIGWVITIATIATIGAWLFN